MKKAAPILCFLFWGIVVVGIQSTAYSQITIGVSDLPSYFTPGTSWFTYVNNDSVEHFNLGVASTTTAQTWTVPAMTFIDSTRLDNIALSSSYFAADFPGASYVMKTSQTGSGLTFDTYQYFGFSNDSLFMIGMGQHFYGSSGGASVDTAAVQHGLNLLDVLPIQLGYSRIFPSDTSAQGGGIVDIRTETKICDAYGTLNLPIGSFEALRMKTTYKTYVYSGSTLVNVDSSFYFQWMTREGHKLEIDDDTTSSGVAQVTSMTVTYVLSTPTGVKKDTEIPAHFALEQNYPNPFNPSTMISYEIPTSSRVVLKVYDVLGREVRTLVNQVKQPGKYQVRFVASGLPSGVYFYRLLAGTRAETKKLMLTK